MNLGLLGAGLVLGIAAMGSAIGIGIAAQAAVGAWKKCYIVNKPAPMTLLVFVGAPLTQVFYAYIMMTSIINVAASSSNADYSLLQLGFSVASALAIAGSAILQGKAGAAAADAQAETGKGFAQYIAAIGVIETVALFTMVLTMNSLL